MTRRREEPLPAEIRSRGLAAKAELPVMDDAFEIVRARLFEEWMNTRPADTDRRERIYHTLYGLASARNVLIEAINAGELQEGSDAVADILNGRDPVV